MEQPLSDFELGWLSGLLEGEGNFDYDGKTQRVRLEMTDEDTVLKAAGLIYKIIGKMPAVTERDAVGSMRQSSFGFGIYGANARTVMCLLVSSMCYRRKQRIWQSLNEYIQPKSNLKAADIVKLVCRNG